MDGLAITREYFPELSEDERGYILWNKTGWPGFFMEGEKSLREQLAKLKRAWALHRDVCDCCGKIRFRSQLDDFGFCKSGMALLDEGKSA
jgi:hypothetical protein